MIKMCRSVGGVSRFNSLSVHMAKYKIVRRDTGKVVFENDNKAVVEDRLDMLKETMPEEDYVMERE